MTDEEKLAELQGEKQEQSDMFYGYQQIIDSLEGILRKKDSDTTYVQPAQPAPKRSNYVLYIGIGLLALVLLRKVKL